MKVIKQHHGMFGNLEGERLIKVFLIVLALGLAYSFPIWIADRYYIDDLGRSILGYTGWENNGRPLASAITMALNFEMGVKDGHLIDFSPLPQILAVIVLAFAASILSCTLLPEDADLSAAIVAFPIIGSPYLLENLSYKFDSISMAVAIGASIFAAINHRNKAADVVIGGLLIMAAFSLYQPSVNVFIGASALLLLSGYWNEKAKPATMVPVNVAKLSLGYVGYKILILRLYPLDAGYSAPHSLTIPMGREGLAIFYRNFHAVANIVSEYFSQAILLAVFSVVSIAVFGWLFVAKSATEKGRMFRLIIFLGINLALVFSIFGLLGFLRDPIIAPRTLVGFGVFLVYVFYCFHESVPDRFKALRFLSLLPILYFFYISFGYAAAAKAQSRYDFFLASDVLRNIERIGFEDGDFLIFDGVQPRSPVLKNSEQVKIIGRLVPLYVNNQWMWGSIYFRHFGIDVGTIEHVTDKLILKICESGADYRSSRYAIYKEENKYLVSFEGGLCFGKP